MSDYDREFTINLNLNLIGDTTSLPGRILGLLEKIDRELDLIRAEQKKEGVRTMTVSNAVKDLSDKFDEALNEIAADLDALREAAKERPLSAEELAIFDAKLERLRVLGADPENPIPVEV